MVRQHTDIASSPPTGARRDGQIRRPLTRLAGGVPALGRGLVTLGLALALAACGGETATQVGSVLATQAPAATATVAAAPTAASSPTPAPTATIVPATPTVAPIPTQPSAPTATRAAAVTPTRPASNPTAAPATGGGVVRDENSVCQVTLPTGYTVDSNGDGFDADDEQGFGVLSGATGRSESPEELAQSVYESFTSVMESVQQGEVTTTADSSQIDFTSTLADNPGQGTVYVRSFGTSVCAMSVFTYDDAQVSHTTAISALIAALDEIK